MRYKLYKQSVNKIFNHFLLKLKTGADMRFFTLERFFSKKNVVFCLKTALFVEKRQNKFAHELK
jgi:hypothetical protein